MPRCRPQLSQERRIQVGAIGDHDARQQAPGLEVLQEAPHVILVIGPDQGEGDGKVAEGIGCQQQGVLPQVQLIDAQRAAEACQDLLAMFRQVQLLHGPVEAVVDEAAGEVQQEVPAHALAYALDI